MLVAVDIGLGSELVRALDQSDVTINVALWLYTDEYEDPRFVLASPQLDATSSRQQAYGLIHDALDAAGIPVEKTPALLILPMPHPFIRALRKMFAKHKNVEGTRLGGQLIGDRFVDDAILYRVR